MIALDSNTLGILALLCQGNLLITCLLSWQLIIFSIELLDKLEGIITEGFLCVIVASTHQPNKTQLFSLALGAGFTLFVTVEI